MGVTLMKKLSNSSIITVFTRVLVLLVIAKAISFALWLYLPNEGVELVVKKSYQPKYQKVDFNNMIQRAKREQDTLGQSTHSAGASINSMILKGLYGSKDSGFIIIAMKSNPKKTTIVSIGEVYHGYTLHEITPSSAIFKKGSKGYVLNLAKLKASAESRVTKVKRDTPLASNTQRDVTRKDISYYAKDPDKIWKDISIVEVKDGENIKGFKVTRINSNSALSSLGLKTGDLIVRANNIDLKSYRDALNIYKNIDNLDVVQIVVVRNNQEMELVYEIN